MRGTRLGVALAAILLAASTVRADDPPTIEHSPAACTDANKAVYLCAAISDDQNVSAARLYFRKAGDDFYSFVDMAFGGTQYCGTLPAPREGKVRTIEYYVQAVDDQFQAQRTSTFQLRILPAGQCEFPQVVKGNQPLAIKVFATHKKQGARFDDAFDKTGVTFVPLGSK